MIKVIEQKRDIAYYCLTSRVKNIRSRAGDLHLHVRMNFA